MSRPKPSAAWLSVLIVIRGRRSWWLDMIFEAKTSAIVNNHGLLRYAGHFYVVHPGAHGARG